MAYANRLPGGGGSEGNATVINVLEGKTFSNDTDVGLVGTIKTYMTGNVSTAATCLNQPSNARIHVKIPVTAYYLAGVSIRLPYADIVEALGITADKIVKGQSIAGVYGTVVPATT